MSPVGVPALFRVTGFAVDAGSVAVAGIDIGRRQRTTDPYGPILLRWDGAGRAFPGVDLAFGQIMDLETTGRGDLVMSGESDRERAGPRPSGSNSVVFVSNAAIRAQVRLDDTEPTLVDNMMSPLPRGITAIRSDGTVGVLGRFPGTSGDVGQEGLVYIVAADGRMIAKTLILAPVRIAPHPRGFVVLTEGCLAGPALVLLDAWGRTLAQQCLPLHYGSQSFLELSTDAYGNAFVRSMGSTAETTALVRIDAEGRVAGQAEVAVPAGSRHRISAGAGRVLLVAFFSMSRSRRSVLTNLHARFQRGPYPRGRARATGKVGSTNAAGP